MLMASLFVQAQTDDEAVLRAQLLEKQRELLYLQQKQMDLELEQARKKLAQSAVFHQRSVEQAPAPVILVIVILNHVAYGAISL